jgi:hypothetical protein
MLHQIHKRKNKCTPRISFYLFFLLICRLSPFISYRTNKSNALLPPLSPLPQLDNQKRKSQNQSHTIIRPMRNTFPALLPSFRHSHKTKDTPLLPHHNNNNPNRSHSLSVSLFLSPQNSKTKIQLSSPSLHFGFKYFHRAQNLHAMASVCVCVCVLLLLSRTSPKLPSRLLLLTPH